MIQLPIQQAFQIALQHHQAGQLPQAEALYRQILAQQPNHADALHLLGVIAHQAGRNDIAVDLIRQAITLNPEYAEAYSNLGSALRDSGQLDAAIAAFRQAIALRPQFTNAFMNLGNALRTAGHLDEAISVCRQAVALNPHLPEAHNNLGVALKDNGQLADALTAYRQAIALKSTYPEAHNNLGIALKDQGQLDEAIAAFRTAIVLNPRFPEAQLNLGSALTDNGCANEAIAACRQALALRPDYPEAFYNLANALRNSGQLDESIAAYRKALDLKPNLSEAWNNLGNVLREKGQLDQAIAACRQAVALNPNFSAAHNNLGNALRDKGHLDEAIAACRQAIALQPRCAEGHLNLANALKDKGLLDDAVTTYRQAIALAPELPEAYSNLANALTEQGQLDDAIALYHQALALRPHYAEACVNLGNALKEKGQLDDAIAAFRQALALQPDLTEAHNNLVFVLHCHPGYDAAAIAQELRAWNRQHAEPLKQHIQPHANPGAPDQADRRLRVAYVSPDLRDHAVGRFLLPLLAHHHRHQVEVFCYAQVTAPDAMTERLRACSAAWRSIVGLTDAQAADLIRQDRIDILVDLAMHAAHNRILVFARKPAPVQLTYLAYCSTTGLETIDYRLSDPHLDPPGMDESIYRERTIRLPETYWCYQPSIATPEVGPSPALKQGAITFGCLNNFCKVGAAPFAAWTKLLRMVPNSQLLLHAHAGSHRQRAQEHLAREGLDPQRVRFVGKVPMPDYFRLYHQIDIALDTFPYGGGTTTCDALWMGVPVVSLVGKTAVGRGGSSILSNIGLPELLAHSEDQYVRLAADLAHDLPRLCNLRSTLRQRMQQSPLTDAPRFARNIEAAYRQMWYTWCAANPANH